MVSQVSTQAVSTVVSLDQTKQAMHELIQPGTPNGKAAFYIAALSAMNGVDSNCLQGPVMRRYANKPLPENHENLYHELKAVSQGPLFTSHINALYNIERLWNAGIIHMNAGITLESQMKWRDEMVKLIKGMSYKTVSFALHIFDYQNCLILTVDRHHFARLGLTPSSSRKPYLEAEIALYAKCDELAAQEGQGYEPLVYAACLWERWRQAKGLGVQGEYTSHAGLSCYC